MVGENPATKEQDAKISKATPEKSETKVTVKTESDSAKKAENKSNEARQPPDLQQGPGHVPGHRGGGRGMGRGGFSRGGIGRGGSSRRDDASFGGGGAPHSGNRDGARSYNTRGGNRGSSSWNNNPRFRDNRESSRQFDQPPPDNRSFNQNTSSGIDDSIWDQNPLDTGIEQDIPHDSQNEVLPPKEIKKFTQRCRLFVGNITADTTEQEFRDMFEPYGKTDELFMNAQKGFGFIRLDYRANAEAAKAALDGLLKKGRTLRVRFAAQAAALKVKNLSPVVSNEMLADAFGQFGEIEKAVVIVDDRGRPTGQGIVEYARKQSASTAFKRITEGVFILTTSPRPVHVEMLIQNDEDDGYPERFVPRNDLFRKEREIKPRFAPPGSFEYNFCQRWKRLFELEKQQEEQLKLLLEEERMKLEGEMENAIMEQHEEMLKQDLLRQQEELRRLQEMRQQNELRRRQEIEMRVQGMRASAISSFSDERRPGRDDRDLRGARDERSIRDERPMPEMARGIKEEFRSSMPGISASLGMSSSHGINTIADKMPMSSIQTLTSGGDMPQNVMGGAQPMQPPPAPPAALQLEMERNRGQGMEGKGDIPKLMPDTTTLPPPTLMSGNMGFEMPPSNYPGFSNAGPRPDDAPQNIFPIRQGGGAGSRDRGRNDRESNDRRREAVGQRDISIEMKRPRRY